MKLDDLKSDKKSISSKSSHKKLSEKSESEDSNF